MMISTSSDTDKLNSETQAAELVNAFTWDGNGLQPGLTIALSGGGFRAMLFHAGALLRLNELGLLSRAARISSVSGGSIAAAFLASRWSELRSDNAGSFINLQERFVAPLLEFSRQNLDVKNILTGLLPGTSAARRMALSYERHLLGTRTLQDIPEHPRFVFCATNLQTGVLWRFSKPYAGDYIVGRLARPKIRLSQVAAASAAFPPVLSPMEFSFTPLDFTDWPSETRKLVPESELLAMRSKICLTDGGVYDNHGLEPVLKRYMTVLVGDGGAPFTRGLASHWDWVRQLRRILDITDNQVRALRRRDLIARFSAGNAMFAAGSLPDPQMLPYERRGAYWGIDTDATHASPAGALPCSPKITKPLALIPTRLADLGSQTGMRLVNWGYAICDRSIRKHFTGAEEFRVQAPAWPFPQASLEK
jgi:NTE family protein